MILWVLGTRSHLPEQLEGVDLGSGKFCTSKHGLFKDVIWCWYYLLPKKRRPWGICLRHLRFGEWGGSGRVSTLLKRPSKVAIKIFWWRTKTRIDNQLRTLSDLYDSSLQWTIPYNPTVQRNQSWKKFFSSRCMGQSVSHATAENRG